MWGGCALDKVPAAKEKGGRRAWGGRDLMFFALYSSLRCQDMMLMSTSGRRFFSARKCSSCGVVSVCAKPTPSTGGLLASAKETYSSLTCARRRLSHAGVARPLARPAGAHGWLILRKSFVLTHLAPHRGGVSALESGRRNGEEGADQKGDERRGCANLRG